MIYYFVSYSPKIKDGNGEKMTFTSIIERAIPIYKEMDIIEIKVICEKKLENEYGIISQVSINNISRI